MAISNWLLSLTLSLGAGGFKVATSPGVEQIPGFPELLSREIGRSFVGTALAKGTGYPVEPGYYVTMTRKQLRVLDKAELALQDGKPGKPVVAAQCRSGCDVAYWTLFSGLWRDSQRSDERARYVHPRRVLWALEKELDAQSFLDSAYAALETWPQATLPAMYVLFDAGPGGVRSRQFRLMPPAGVDTATQSATLEFRIRVYPGQEYELSARAPGFALGGKKSGVSRLSERLSQVKRRYPGKRAVVLEPMPGTTIGDLSTVMDATLELFPEVVLDRQKASTGR